MRWKIVGLAVIALIGGVLTQEPFREGAVPAAQEVIAPALAVWIMQSRDAAIERGVEAIPGDIRAAFLEFVPTDVLERVRWRVDGETGLVGRVLFQPGTVRAVTLDNVILFGNADEAANVKLWAHELFHVMQYGEWGVEGFAERFVADHRAIEHDAREFRWSWMKATGRVPEF